MAFFQWPRSSPEKVIPGTGDLMMSRNPSGINVESQWNCWHHIRWIQMVSSDIIYVILTLTSFHCRVRLGKDKCIMMMLYYIILYYIIYIHMCVCVCIYCSLLAFLRWDASWEADGALDAAPGLRLWWSEVTSATFWQTQLLTSWPQWSQGLGRSRWNNMKQV